MEGSNKLIGWRGLDLPAGGGEEYKDTEMVSTYIGFSWTTQ